MPLTKRSDEWAGANGGHRASRHKQIPVTIGPFLYLTTDCELLYMNHHHLFFFSFFSP